MKISKDINLPVSYNDDRNAVVDADGFNIAEDVYSNATAIVTAVNNHDKLVEALKNIRANLEYGHNSFDEAYYVIDKADVIAKSALQGLEDE